MHAIAHALSITASMTWEITWALIPGFALSRTLARAADSMEGHAAMDMSVQRPGSFSDHLQFREAMVKIISVVSERMKAKSAVTMVQALIAWERDPGRGRKHRWITVPPYLSLDGLPVKFA